MHVRVCVCVCACVCVCVCSRLYTRDRKIAYVNVCAHFSVHIILSFFHSLSMILSLSLSLSLSFSLSLSAHTHIYIIFVLNTYIVINLIILIYRIHRDKSVLHTHVSVRFSKTYIYLLTYVCFCRPLWYLTGELYMYVYVSIYAYVCEYRYIYIYIYIYIFTHICARACVCVCVFV